MKRYNAPWCTGLIVVSTLFTVFMLGLSVSAWWYAFVKQPPIPLRWSALLPLVILFSGVLFTIRGYTITPDAILVHRLLWDTRLPRHGLESAILDPKALRWSLRTFGNGGVFSVSGFFWNKRLRSFRALLTDPKRAVILRYANRRVVLSPDAPEEFIQDLSIAKPSRPNSPFS